LVAEQLQRDTTAEWFERLKAAGIPAVPYNRVDDLFTDPHLDAVGLLQETEHPTEGTLVQCPLPITFDGERPVASAPAPGLGVDSDVVLDEIRRDQRVR